MAPWQQDLIAQIRRSLYAEIGPFYSTNDEPALHEVSRTGDEVTFLFDHYVYNYAQSGSDWADHYFVRGTATVDGDRLLKSAFTRVRTIHLTESDTNHYSPSRITALMIAGRDHEVNAALGEPPSWSDDGPEPAY